MTTIANPGPLHDSAIGQIYGVDGTARANDLMTQTMWGRIAFTVPGMIGFMVALPLAALALWRAGRVRWWAPLAVLAGYAAFMLSNVMWWGCAITTICFTVFAVAVERGTRTS